MIEQYITKNNDIQVLTVGPDYLSGCDFVKSVAAASFNVSIRDLNSRTRNNANAAFARQVAMYLCHTVLCLKPGKIAAAFNRDRTTVNYACRLVEDHRDDPQLDFVVGCMERSIEEWLAFCRLRSQDVTGQ